MTPQPEASATLVNPAVLVYRVDKAEEAIKTKAEKEDLEEVRDELKGIKKMLWGLLAGIVGSSVLVSFTLFATLGAHLGG